MPVVPTCQRTIGGKLYNIRFFCEKFDTVNYQTNKAYEKSTILNAKCKHNQRKKKLNNIAFTTHLKGKHFNSDKKFLNKEITKKNCKKKPTSKSKK